MGMKKDKSAARQAKTHPRPAVVGRRSVPPSGGRCKCEETVPNAGDDLIICRCEEVLRGEIRQAIAEGATTLVEIKWRTRAGMGLCQAKTCRRLVTQILAEQTGRPVAEIHPSTHRPPVRPVELGIIARTEEM
jgi:NAD(P)H-nitrite reductase large subunit